MFGRRGVADAAVSQPACTNGALRKRSHNPLASCGTSFSSRGHGASSGPMYSPRNDPSGWAKKNIAARRASRCRVSSSVQVCRSAAASPSATTVCLGPGTDDAASSAESTNV